MSDEAAILLSRAIVKQAFKDYRYILKHDDKGSVTLKELELFFDGPLFGLMSGGRDPEVFLSGLRRGRCSSENRNRKRRMRLNGRF